MPGVLVASGTGPFTYNEESKMTDNEIEKEMQAAGLTALRITPDDVEDKIVATYTFTADKATQHYPQHPSLKLLTISVLVLRNGFVVTGESACASPENFNAEIGAKIAYDNAKQKVWELEGYLLKERLYKESSLFAHATA